MREEIAGLPKPGKPPRHAKTARREPGKPKLKKDPSCPPQSSEGR
jgi:hypothetical protein